MRIAQLCNSHGFFNGWLPTKYHHEIFRNITAQIEKQYTGNCIVVDDTWISKISDEESFVAMYPNVMREHIDHIFFINLLDDPSHNYSDGQNIIQQLTVAKHKHSMINKSKFSFWAYFCQCEFWKDYHQLDLPWTGDKLFLTYNRKPAPHRTKLVSALDHHDLLGCGIITLGNIDPRCAITLDENIAILSENIDGDVGVPNDIVTLGDHGLWQNAFVNIVTETVTHGNFLSEKIWKPIIGKRPFMVVGPPGSLEQLHDWGFKTFSDFWPEEYNYHNENDQIDEICKILSMLDEKSIPRIRAIYDEMKDVLEYNHNHFFTTFVKDNRKLIDTIVKDEM